MMSDTPAATDAPSLPTPDTDTHSSTPLPRLDPLDLLPTHIDPNDISKRTCHRDALPLPGSHALVPPRIFQGLAAPMPQTAFSSSLVPYQPFGAALGLSFGYAHAHAHGQAQAQRTPYPQQPLHYRPALAPIAVPHEYSRLGADALPTPASTADAFPTPASAADLALAPVTPVTPAENLSASPTTSQVAETTPATKSKPATKPRATKTKPKTPATNNRLAPQDELPKAIVDRFFVQYAKKIGGVVLSKGDKRYWHFDDATRPKAPEWPAELYSGLIHFYAESARPRRKRDPDLVTYPAVKRFAENVRRFYARNKGDKLPSELVKKATARMSTVIARKHGGNVEHQVLNMERMLALSRAVWSPEYAVSFRQRVDIALYIALILATGLTSEMLLPPALPADDDMNYLIKQNKDGARWNDFRLFATPHGPMVSFRRRAGTERIFCINPGPILGLSVAELAMLAMYLDSAISHEDHSLEYFLSPSFWGGTQNQWRLVESDGDKCGNHVWRNPTNNAPLLRSDMNAELRRLGKIAGLEKDVTSGAIRRFVTEKVYQTHGFEACHNVLDHKSVAYTRKYLNKTLVPPATQEETKVGYNMPEAEAEAWRKQPSWKRKFTFHQNTNILIPAAWTEGVHKPTPPTPSRTKPRTDLLSIVGEWMAGPQLNFRQQVHLATEMRKWQYFERVPDCKTEFHDMLMTLRAKAHEPQSDETWDEESLDSDDE